MAEDFQHDILVLFLSAGSKETVEFNRLFTDIAG